MLEAYSRQLYRFSSRLRLVGVVHGELERIETRVHARPHPLGRRERAVRREERILDPTRLGVADGIREPVAHERLADEEEAELLDTRVDHLAYEPRIERPGHLAPVLQPQAMGAEAAAIVAL